MNPKRNYTHQVYCGGKKVWRRLSHRVCWQFASHAWDLFAGRHLNVFGSHPPLLHLLSHSRHRSNRCQNLLPHRCTLATALLVSSYDVNWDTDKRTPPISSHPWPLDMLLNWRPTRYRSMQSRGFPACGLHFVLCDHRKHGEISVTSSIQAGNHQNEPAILHSSTWS